MKSVSPIANSRLKEMALCDRRIDTSDIPELGESFFQNARQHRYGGKSLEVKSQEPCE